MTNRYFTSYWYGTRMQYANVSKSNNTLYFISDENKLCRGNQPFAEDVEKVICVAAVAPSVAVAGQKYFNTVSNKIFQCIASSSGESIATWGNEIAPCAYIVYYDLNNKTLYSWDGHALAGMCSGASAVSAAASAASAAASAVLAANTRYNCEVANLEYSDILGNYRALTRIGDTLKLAYAVSSAITISLHLKSANSAISGNVSLALKLNGAPVHLSSVSLGENYTWHDIILNEPLSGMIEIALVTELSDGGVPVSVVINDVRVSAQSAIPAGVGRVERQVAAHPLCYSMEIGYYLRLDADYQINLCYRINGLNAVALKIKSANPEISGNIAIIISAGAAVKTATIPVGAAAEWQIITFDAVVDGDVKIVRDLTSADDTLKDGNAAVTAIVSDINYYYQEK